MKLLRDGYADELPVPLSEFERAQLLRRIELELDGRPRRSRPLFVGVAAVLGIAGGFALSFLLRQAPEETAPLLVVPSTVRETLELPDGSRALLDAAAQLRIDAAEPMRIRITLLEGRASFEVGAVEGRSFVIAAGSVDINVPDGKVTVMFSPAPTTESNSADWSVEVQTTEGRASVHRKFGGGPPVTLEAGESWSNVSPPPAELGAARRPDRAGVIEH